MQVSDVKWYAKNKSEIYGNMNENKHDGVCGGTQQADRCHLFVHLTRQHKMKVGMGV